MVQKIFRIDNKRSKEFFHRILVKKEWWININIVTEQKGRVDGTKKEKQKHLIH